MNSMHPAIQPKSDQLNADSLLGHPITIKITGVEIAPGGEQPVTIHYEGENGRPYKPCKSMCRVMVAIWGDDANQYTGRMLTLYRDPEVMWGGMKVGGIRISHASHIDGKHTMALTATRGNRKPFTVLPLKNLSPTPAAMQLSAEPAGARPADTDAPAGTDAGAEDDSERLARRQKALEAAAKLGKAALSAEWKRTTKTDGEALGGARGEQMNVWIAIAAAADKERETNTPALMAG